MWLRAESNCYLNSCRAVNCCKWLVCYHYTTQPKRLIFSTWRLLCIFNIDFALKAISSIYCVACLRTFGTKRIGVCLHYLLFSLIDETNSQTNSARNEIEIKSGMPVVMYPFTMCETIQMASNNNAMPEIAICSR